MFFDNKKSSKKTLYDKIKTRMIKLTANHYEAVECKVIKLCIGPSYAFCRKSIEKNQLFSSYATYTNLQPLIDIEYVDI